jgi:beta-galactosidase/beta-glucuronidase
MILSLNGEWEIEDSVLPDDIPEVFEHKVRVPGMVNQSVPPFQNVDRFDGLDYLQNAFVRTYVKKVNVDTVKVGIPRQRRNYFWYRKEFNLNERKDLVLLRINKAQFGTAVWVNGEKAGTHMGCFTSGKFDITDLVNQNGTNVLMVRIGAHPGALPAWAPSGSDYEKPKWTPGIYDEVSIITANYPYISTVQIAPDIYQSIITVQSKMINKGKDREFTIEYNVEGATMNTPATYSEGEPMRIREGDTLVITDTIQIENAKLWSPEDPNLYWLEVKTGSDENTVRFGMREFKFDTRTKLAYLNGNGSNAEPESIPVKFFRPVDQ